MAKSSSIYVCQQCGYQAPSFLGKCPECNSWNSLVEQVSQITTSKSQANISFNPDVIINLSDIDKINYKRLSTGLGEFDRVLGGGIVAGSVVLVTGDPGIGKSTLLSQLALNVKESLYVAGEESAKQIKIRIDRIKLNANLPIFNETDVDIICRALEKVKPGLAIIDSIQTLETQDLNAAPGSVSQVRESAHRLQRLAKKLHIPIFIVGHITKEGSIAGPKVLEHLVDVVLSLEGDSTSDFRVLRASKNRFGPTDEVGIFEMAEAGMKEVLNPSQLLLEQRVQAPGSAVVTTLNGARPLLMEIQALVTKSFLAIPRRVSTGIDNNRLQLLIAVLTKRLNLNLYNQDIFVNVAGGFKVSDAATDLGVCVAVASSLLGVDVVPNSIFIGEVGLLGELRTVRQFDKRLKEAQNLGFSNIISYKSAKSLKDAVRAGLVSKKLQV